MNTAKITCPNCHHQFNAEEALAKTIEEKYRLAYVEDQRKLKAEQLKESQKIEEKFKLLEKQQIEFDEKAKQAREEYAERLKKDREKIQEEIKAKAEKEAREQSELKLKDLQETLDKEKFARKELEKKELEFMKQVNELKEKEENLELQIQKRILEEKQKVENETKLKESQKFELERKEFKKKMEDQQKLIDEMKRKAEQGSMQMQGEVQELAIEEELKSQFPFDLIEEVSKGVRGADCVQTVRNNLGVECGKIIYESKRTKAFSNEWINKLKDDARLAGAEVAVLVTETLPKDQKNFDLVNGVWVCHFGEFKSLALALRDGLVKVQQVQESNVNKGDKMQMLYSFLTGNEFRAQVEGIIEGFTTLREDLEKEKRAMMNLWKKREKQIEKVMLNTVNMYSSIEGIAGSSVQSIDSLGLGGLLDE